MLLGHVKALKILAFCAIGRRAEFCDLSQLLISCALVAVQLVRMTLRMRSRPLK